MAQIILHRYDKEADMIICTGEILADMIGKIEDGRVCYDRFAGGAPFNVACGLKKLGAKCGFCGCVGEDLIGDFLEDFAKSRGFDYLHLVRDQTRNTTLAFVELNEAGERKFSFFRKNTADYALPAAAADEIADIAHVAHLGSLPLTQPQGRAFADTLIAKMHAKGKKVTFDVNYRDDLFANEEEGVALYKKYVEAADIVKFSEEELVLFAAGETPEDRLKTIAGTDKVALVTLGERGSMACVCGKIYRSDSIRVHTVDTTGAGDAFFAGVLSALDEGETDWNRILRRGNVCGALATEKKGAIDAFPDRDFVQRSL